MAGMKSFSETEKINLRIDGTKNGVDDVVIEFLQRVADCRPRTQRQTRALSVRLLGEEPLRWFPVIQEVVNRVKRSNVEWTLTTDGARLTPTMVDFFNAGHFNIILSHEGPRTEEICGVDVLKNPDVQGCLKALKRFSVESVVTAYSQDVYSVREYINEALDRQVPVQHEFLTLLVPVSEELLAYDIPSWQMSCACMAEVALEQFMSKQFGWESDWCWRYISNYYDFAEGTNPLCNCSTRGKILTIDGSGRVWRCINAVYPIGTATSDCRELNQRSEENIIRLYQENKRFCGECRWFPFCHGHCPRELNTPQQAKQCEFMGIFFESVATVMSQFEDFKLQESKCA